MQHSNILPINSLLTKINTIFEKIQIKNNNQYWNQLVLLNNILRKHYLVYSKQIGQLVLFTMETGNLFLYEKSS